MAVITGTYGEVRTSTGVLIGELTKWELRRLSDNKRYVSNKTSGYAKRAVGARDSVGTLDAILDSALTRTFEVGDTFTVRFYPNINTLTDYIQVPIIIDEEPLTCDIDGSAIVAGSVAFSGNGAWTLFGCFAVNENITSS